MLVQAQRVLRLVHKAMSRAAMHSIVLGAAHLVAKRLASGLVTIWLGFACDLVGGACQVLFGLVERRFGGVRLLQWDVNEVTWRGYVGKKGKGRARKLNRCGRMVQTACWREREG